MNYEKHGENKLTQVLVGWKEIAAFLRVSLATAKVWAKKDGFPVISVRKGCRKRVWTSTDLIHVWMAKKIELQRQK